MRPGLCLLLLGAAADDRVVLRREDAAPVSVPPLEPGTRRALRREDAAVPPRRGRADPAGVPAPPPDPGRARRDLQASDDDEACQYVSVSGTTGQTSREGTYERAGECAARPYYECLDCSASDPQFLWYTGSQWFIGPGGCGATVAGMYINDAVGDLAALTGNWAESPFTEENPAIAVECPTEAPTPLARTGRWLEGLPCNYVSVSGSTYQSGRHGLYEASLCDDGTPLYTCLDCSSSEQKIWLNGNGWVIGSAGCGSGSGGIFSPYDPDGDLAAISGTWEEWTGSAFFSNSDIAVTCYSFCKKIGSTAKYRCFDCADASAQASVGDGNCDAENNVDPCYDGGDLCGNQILRHVLLNRRVNLHAIDATPARWRGDVHPTHWLISTQASTRRRTASRARAPRSTRPRPRRP